VERKRRGRLQALSPRIRVICARNCSHTRWVRQATSGAIGRSPASDIMGKYCRWSIPRRRQARRMRALTAMTFRLPATGNDPRQRLANVLQTNLDGMDWIQPVQPKAWTGLYET